MDKIKSFIGKIKHIFKKKPRLMVGLVIALALSLPFIINQVLKQQDLRQRASSAPSISFNFSPSTKTVNIGETFTINLVMNAGSNDIGGLKVTLGFDPAKLQFTNGTTSTPLVIIQKTEDDAHGLYTATYVNPTTTIVTGNALTVHSFVFKALTSGATQIAIKSDIQATASTYDTYVPIDNAGSITAAITVVDSQISTIPSPTQVCKTGANTISVSEPCGTGLNRKVNYVCYDGFSGSLGDSTSCKTSELWKTYADSACEGRTSCTSLTPSPTQAIATSPTPTKSPTPSPTPTLTPVPTATLVPTATIAPGETTLKLIVQLTGIGTGAANLGLNPHPIRPQRTGSIQVLDGTTILVKSASALMTYETQCGCYTGTFALGPTFASGSYTAKVKFDNSLYKAFPGIIQIASGQNANSAVPTVTLVTGDITGPQNLPDNTLDILDYNLLQACYRGQPACTTSVAKLADFNDDGVVRGDDIDANIQARGFYIRNGD